MEIQADLWLIIGWGVAAALAGIGVTRGLRLLPSPHRPTQGSGDEREEMRAQSPVMPMATVTEEARRQDLENAARAILEIPPSILTDRRPSRPAPTSTHITNFQRLYASPPATFHADPTGIFGSSSYEAAIEMRRARLQAEAELNRYKAMAEDLKNRVTGLEADIVAAQVNVARTEETLNKVVEQRDQLRAQVDRHNRSDLPNHKREELKAALATNAALARVLASILSDEHPPDHPMTA